MNITIIWGITIVAVILVLIWFIWHYGPVIVEDEDNDEDEAGK
jgi:hypothetical protein